MEDEFITNKMLEYDIEARFLKFRNNQKSLRKLISDYQKMEDHNPDKLAEYIAIYRNLTIKYPVGYKEKEKPSVWKYVSLAFIIILVILVVVVGAYILYQKALNDGYKEAYDYLGTQILNNFKQNKLLVGQTPEGNLDFRDLTTLCGK